jgi:hypothetical protein
MNFYIYYNIHLTKNAINKLQLMNSGKFKDNLYTRSNDQIDLSTDPGLMSHLITCTCFK